MTEKIIYINNPTYTVDQNKPQKLSFDNYEQAKQKTRSEVDEMSTSEPNDYKELVEDDIEFLMDNTGFTCEQIRRWHVEFLNKCPSGLIKFDQFTAYYKILLPSGLAEEAKDEIVLKLFQLFDIDADQCLNFSEFLISFWVRCKAPTREKFTWVFNMLDEDRNGNLNYQEIKNALSLCLDVETLDALLEQLNKEIQRENRFSIYANPLSGDGCSDDDDDDESFDESFSHLGTEEKLQQVIILLNLLSQKSKAKTLQEVQQERDLFLSSIVLFEDSRNSESNKRQLKYAPSEESDSLKNAIKKIQITRESFIDLAEKFKLLRKLVLPIHNFYED